METDDYSRYLANNRLIDAKTGTFNLDSIATLGSCLGSSIPKHIQSLQPLFGIFMTPADIVEQLKNPNSLLHRFTSEVILSFFKYTAVINETSFQQLQETLKKREVEALLTEEEEEEAAAKLQNNLQELDWNQARANLEKLKDKESPYQKLMKQNVLELDYLMQTSLSDESKQTIFDSIRQRNAIMEDQAILAGYLRSEYENPETSPRRRQEIMETLDVYESHQRLSSLETKIKMIGEHLKDAATVVAATVKGTVVEELHRRFLKEKVDEPLTDSLPPPFLLAFYEKKTKYSELLQKLATGFDLFTERNPEEATMTTSCHTKILQVLDDLKLMHKNPDPEAKERIKENIKSILSEASDEKYNVITNSLKKYHEEEEKEAYHARYAPYYQP